jgi:hypothetical protein
MERRLLFRRQFILSTNPAYRFEDWKNINLDNEAYLSAHPDLEVTQSCANGINLIVLGFILDPFSPKKTNQEILDNIISQSSNFADVINKSEYLSGRWAFIYKDKNGISVLHDPCGQRQVYFYQSKSDILCGSDPAILNHFTKLEKDDSPALQEFINSPKFKKRENAWLGSGTIFRGVKHLLPNHYLNFKNLKAIRFWPSIPLDKIDLEQGIEVAAQILKGTLTAANNRYKLALAVTAGWDSRILLAASKEIHKDVTYFVNITRKEDKNIPDVRIPSRLFRQLGVPFKVQVCDKAIDPEFERILKNNLAMARTDLPKTKHIYKSYLDFSGMLSINGNASEIAKLITRPPFPIKLNGASLSNMPYFGYSGLSYAASELDCWINEISSPCHDSNTNIFDMFYWEQRMGNWGAQYPAEQDTAIEQLSPFNNRLLLRTMLSVDEKYRTPPTYTLQYKIMEKLWPETLQQPLGVQSFRVKTRYKIRFLVAKAIRTFQF